MKHKLSAILMAFILTTPAAFAAPEAANGTEATTGTTGTTTTTTGATTTATTTGGVAAGAVGTATVVGVATAVGVATLAVVAANDSGDGGSHNTSTTTSTTRSYCFNASKLKLNDTRLRYSYRALEICIFLINLSRIKGAPSYFIDFRTISCGMYAQPAKYGRYISRQPFR